jgi:hypothetical protein
MDIRTEPAILLIPRQIRCAGDSAATLLGPSTSKDGVHHLYFQ